MLRRKSLCARVLGILGLAVSAAVIPADHAESPGADADPAADLADVFIFPSPENAQRMVAAITFGGRSAPRSRIDQTLYCDPNVQYQLHVDRAAADGTFDNLPDFSVTARLTPQGGACSLELENVPGSGGNFSGPSETVFSSGSGLRAFAGLRNDPFFFDAEGYAALVASFAAAGQSGDVVTAFGLGTRARRDSFANRNVSAIVFEMDVESVSPTVAGARRSIRVWSTTARRVL